MALRSVALGSLVLASLGGQVNAATPPPPSTLAGQTTCQGSVGPGLPPPPSVPSGIEGFHASWYGQSGYPTLCPGERASAVVAFYNSGSRGWVSGRMGEMAFLGTWDPIPGQDQPSMLGGDGQFGSPSTGWPRYNRVAAQPADYVGPNQIAWFQFTIQAPSIPGTYRLYLRPLIEGATWMEDFGVFWVVTVLNPAAALSVTPSSATVTPGTTQQFTVSGVPTGSTVTWSVSGGCGTITQTGLFAATTVTSSSTACAVVATAKDASGTTTGTGSASVTVRLQLACAASPGTITIGSNQTSTITVRVVDSAGNTVTTNNGTAVTIAQAGSPNQAIGEFVESGARSATVSTTNGVATFTLRVTSATVAGTDQLSASAAGSSGCLVNVTFANPGAPRALSISAAQSRFNTSTTPQSTTVTVTLLDETGTVTTARSATLVTLTSSDTRICAFGGSATTTTTIPVGRSASDAIPLTVTGTAGSCTVTASAADLLSGSTVVTTTAAGAAAGTTLSSDSPKSVPGPVTVTAQLVDASGNPVFSAGVDLGAALDAGCKGTLAQRTRTTDAAGRATFSVSDATAQSCIVTVTGPGTATSTIQIRFTGFGAPAALSASASPDPIPANGVSTSTITVCVTDAAGNIVTSASDQIALSWKNTTQGRDRATELMSGSPQTAVNGCATFTVRSTTNPPATDTYTASDLTRNLSSTNVTVTTTAF